MSKFSDQVMLMNERELENGDWAIVHQALVDAQSKLANIGAGRQTWLDAPIAIALQRAAQNHESTC